MGQQKVFSEASEILRVTKGLDISAKQIENVVHHYGGILEDEFKEEIKQGNHEYSEEEKAIPHYVMADGAMYLTREEKWKEAKLGRVFSDKNHIEEISKNRGLIYQSQYVAHLGTHKEFLDKLEYYLEPLKELIIIADGAKWIWNWADLFYENSVQILDFYHAKQHLCEFALEYFTDEKQRSKWIDEMTEFLSDDKIENVITQLKELAISIKKTANTKKEQLINYYEANKKRMYYKTFRNKGYLIGSGPIESAHRHVMQQRLKLSGQRWTVKGFQQVTNLRVAHKSNQWQKVVGIINKAA